METIEDARIACTNVRERVDAAKRRLDALRAKCRSSDSDSGDCEWDDEFGVNSSFVDNEVANLAYLRETLLRLTIKRETEEARTNFYETAKALGIDPRSVLSGRLHDRLMYVNEAAHMHPSVATLLETSACWQDANKQLRAKYMREREGN